MRDSLRIPHGQRKRRLSLDPSDIDSFGIKYDVGAAGQRFLTSNPLPDQTEKIGVILNWPALLKKGP